MLKKLYFFRHVPTRDVPDTRLSLPGKIYYLTRFSLSLRKNRQLFFLTLFFVAVLSYMMLHTGKDLIRVIGTSPESNAFALLWNNSFFLMLFFFSVMFTFSNVPFHDKISPFLLIRTGKMIFAAAQIVYIFLLSCLIPLFSYLMDYILLPYKKGDGGWGSFWGSIAQDPAAYVQETDITIDYRLMWDFTPDEAQRFTLLVCMLLCFMTGLFLYLLSLFQKKEIGITILTFFIVLSHITKLFKNVVLYRFSPYSWLCLDIITPKYNGILISVRYAVGTLCAVDAILILVVLLKTYRTKEIL